MNETLGLLTMVLSVAFTGALVEWIARARHPERIFYVALGRARTREDEARVRRLRIGNAIVTATGVAFVLIGGPEWLKVVGVSVCPTISALWLVVEASGVARSARLERVPGRWVVSLADPPSLRDYVSVPLQVLNLLVVIVPSALFAWLLGRMPQRVPAHWDAAGNIDRYASPSELWTLAGIMVFDLLLLYVMVWAIAKERWALPEQNAEEYASLQLERRRLMVRMMEWLMLALNTGMGIIWMAVALGSLHGDPELVTTIIGVTVILLLVGCLAPLLIYLPRLSKVADGLRRIAGTEALGTRPNGWIWGGMIYYAPDDPAVFVPKRVGIGQTLNFARPTAWIFLVAVIALPLLISLVAIATAD